jgi:tetratricopeptide (TPR) repeat protein
MAAKVERPSAERVARRAMVLSLVVYRASLEQFVGEAKYETLHRRLSEWVKRLDLAAELEKDERAILRAPLGRADEQACLDASWRVEGLGVLAWALKRLELPLYDDQVSARDATASVGFSEQTLDTLDTAAAQKFLDQARLRPKAEIDAYAVHATLVHWRLRQFNLDGKRMNSARYLRSHVSFKESWLSGLQFVANDLALFGQALSKAPPEYVATFTGAAVERQVAANWLQGDDPVYSHVSADTVLVGLGEGPRPTSPLVARWDGFRKAAAAYNRGLSLTEQGEYAKAVAAFTEAIRHDSTLLDAYCHRADTQLCLGAYDQVVADCNVVIRKSPQRSSDPWRVRGFGHMGREQYDRAIADFDQAIARNPQDQEAYAGRALAYVALGALDHAIADLSEAVQLDPCYALAYLRRGDLYAQQEEHAKAIADYTDVIELGAANASVYHGRGQCYAAVKQNVKAIADFTQAMRLDPEDPDPVGSLAWLRATCRDTKLRNGKQALKWAQRACELSGWQDARYLECLAAAHAELGNFDEAIQWQNRALETYDVPETDLTPARARLRLYEQRKPYRQ